MAHKGDQMGRTCGDNSCRNADAVVEKADGSLVFVEPHETFELFEQFLDDIRKSAMINGHGTRPTNVKYAQTRTTPTTAPRTQTAMC